METCNVTAACNACLTELTSAETSSLAEIMKDITIRYDNLLEISFPYSMGFPQAPFYGQTHSEWIFYVHFIRRCCVRRTSDAGHTLLSKMIL